MEEVSTVVRMCQTHRQHNKDRTVPAAAGQPGGGRRGRVIGVRGSLWVSRFLGRSDTPEPHSACTSCSGCSPVEGRLTGLVVRNGGRGAGGGTESPVLHPSAQLAPAPTHTGWWPSWRRFVELSTARPAWSCPLCGTKAAKQR